MGRNFHQRRSQLGIESLEERAMLAVTTFQDVDGNLLITGSNDVEDITLFFGETLNEEDELVRFVEIVGDVADGEQTTFFDVADLTINMNGGGDFVTLFGDVDPATVAVAGDLSINMGGGSDTFTAAGINVAGNLSITTSASSVSDFDAYFVLGDSSVLDAASVGGSLSLSGGAGAEELNVSYVSIGSDLVVSTGAGNDAVNVVNSLADDVFASLGNGQDTFTWLLDDDSFEQDDVTGSMTLLGAETVTLQGASDTTAQLDIGGLTIIGSSQADHIEIRYADISGATIITTDGGSDYVEIEYSTLDVGLISTGASSDTVVLEQTDFGLMILLGGAGSDTLIATGIDDPYLALSF